MDLKLKYPKLINFEAESVWDGKTGGTATISQDQTIHLDTPETFGGLGQGMCPDELFVSALLGCLNNTFLDFQRRFEIQLVSLDLQGKTTVEFDGAGYLVSGITISGRIETYNAPSSGSYVLAFPITATNAGTSIFKS